MSKRILQHYLVCVGVCLGLLATGQIFLADRLEAATYRKATEGNEVVMNKLYPKKKKFELAADGGKVLNQSYVDSYIAHLSGTYFMSEEWGFSADLGIVINKDKIERQCIETFYNDPKSIIGNECAATGNPDEDLAAGSDGNYGPAYVPIRELKYLIAGNAIWNPIYGKQIIGRAATSYFDLYLSFGGGVVMSSYYPQQEILKNDKYARGIFDSKNPANNPGATPDEDYAYGTAGRPDPISKISPMICGSVGQKYHFAKQFIFRIEVKNYILLATEEGFETFFTLWGGLGVRL